MDYTNNNNMDYTNNNIDINNSITFQISDPIWWGYNINIEKETLLTLNSKENIVKYVIDNLEATLISLNLLPQSEFLKEKKKDFHIHGGKFNDILEHTDIVYIC